MQITIQNWLNELKVQGLSDETIRAYEWQIQKLVAALPQKTPIKKIKRKMIVTYLAERRETGWGDSTRKLALNAMRSFFKYAVGETKSPVRDIPIPRPKKKLKRTLTERQAYDVLTLLDTSSPTGVRNLALLTIMLDTGLRAKEICAIRLDQLDLESGTLIVKIKGGDDGIAVFTDYTANCVRMWLAVRETSAMKDVKTLFVSIGGNTPGQSLTKEGLKCIFRAIARQVGLEKFSPHDMRRSFATLATIFGAPTELLRIAGRWNDLDTLIRYTQAVRAVEIKKYLPVQKLMEI